MNARRIALTIGLCMLLFQGTAYGIVGVDDNVPAQELIFPFICEGTIGADNQAVFGSFNTLWSYAETKGQDTIVYLLVRNSRGVMVLDYTDHLTPRDVSGGDCQSVVKMMSMQNQQQLLATIGGKEYFVGYLTVYIGLPVEVYDSLIGWVTLYDSNVYGENRAYTAANFKPYQAEGGAHPGTFDENGEWPIYADEYYLRYDLRNHHSETFNWWIVLKGANYCDLHHLTCTSSTRLEGFLCDEEEHCVSVAIPVPYRLNIIDVANYIPATLFPSGYPKKGFGQFALVEQGSDVVIGGQFSNENFTAFMWSYQRQKLTVKVPYPVDPKKLDKFDFKYGIINDHELWSVIDPADRLRRLLY